jgi:hypothetical protein
VPFYPAADRDVHLGPVPGAVACRCCPGGISRSTRARRYPSDMSPAEWVICEPLLPAPAWLAGRGGRPPSRTRSCAFDAGMSERAIERKHHVGRRTIIKALDSADPRELRRQACPNIAPGRPGCWCSGAGGRDG